MHNNDDFYFLAGEIAAIQGKEENTNPYDDSKVKSNRWVRGYQYGIQRINHYTKLINAT
ncbi:hypothetical protein [Aliivibrio fischeri]|uniref:hypothetical protein n=1 Tax=Aliivibrio fischeri TaxID=668 RepID=UPI000AD2354F|nr:hypothetical protein [Aliivibrio fischeri]